MISRRLPSLIFRLSILQRAGAVGYGAGGSSGGSRPNRCNYGSGANSGVIKDINYKIVNDNAIAVTVGTGGTGGTTYGGGGANGCVAIWW